jgi:hypothetical protein
LTFTATIDVLRQIGGESDRSASSEAAPDTSATRKVVPVLRNGRWGWGVEWSVKGEFPVTRGFFAREAAARAAAERGLGFDTKGVV